MINAEALSRGDAEGRPYSHPSAPPRLSASALNFYFKIIYSGNEIKSQSESFHSISQHF